MGQPADSYAQLVGRRLRDARIACAMSLQDVEATSAGRLPAATVRRYENAELGLPVENAAELAALYGVRLAALLAPDSE